MFCPSVKEPGDPVLCPQSLVNTVIFHDPEIISYVIMNVGFIPTKYIPERISIHAHLQISGRS